MKETAPQPRFGGPFWLKACVTALAIGAVAYLVWTFFLPARHETDVLSLRRAATRTAKGAKSHAASRRATQPVRHDGVTVREGMVTIIADDMTLRAKRGHLMSLTPAMRPTTAPTEEATFMSQAILRITSYPRVAQDLGLSPEQVAQLRSLNPLGRAIVDRVEGERVKLLYALYDASGGAAEPLVEDLMVDALRAVSVAKKDTARQAAIDAPARFYTIITPDKLPKLREIVASPPPTHPATYATKPATKRVVTVPTTRRTATTTTKRGPASRRAPD